MIVDSSGLVAIVRDEPEAETFLHAIDEAATVKISAATLLEAAIVIDSWRDPIVSRRFDELILEIGLIVVPVTAEQVRIARDAYRDFGRGSGHRARLNFGDCFAYALAKVAAEPLLCKGSDFVHTDLTLAIPQRDGC